MKNKKTKAIALTGAGLAILLTSGATLALWNAEAQISNQTIQTGTLTLSANNLQWVWTHRSSGAAIGETNRPAFAPGTQHLVPGDRVVGTSTISDITLRGDSLVAYLYIDGMPANVAAPLTAVLTVPGHNVAAEGNRFVVRDLTPGTTVNLPVTVTVGFPIASSAVLPGGANNGHGRDQSVSLSNLYLRLEQQRGAGAYDGSVPTPAPTPTATGSGE